MRVKKPDLVYVDEIHTRVFNSEHGIQNIPTIGQKQIDLAGEKQLNRNPPIVEGNLRSGEANQNLVARLNELGIIRDESFLGEAIIDPKAYEGFSIVADPDAVVSSTTDTVNYQTIYNVDVTLGVGRWRLWYLVEASFTNSGGGSNDYILLDDTTTIASYTRATQSTRERYSFGGVYPTAGATITGPDTVQWRYKYKVNASGTATCRMPWLLFLFERMG